MQPPPLNFTNIKTTVRGTFNEILNDILKPPPIRNVENVNSQQQIPQRPQQPQNNNNPFIPTNYNHSEFGETFNSRKSDETKQDPIIVNLETGEYNFLVIEQEYNPDSNDEEYEESEQQKEFKNYFKSHFKNNKISDESDKKKRNWKKEEEARDRKRDEQKKEFEEKYPESQPSTTKAGKIRLRFTKEK
jgi:hypothetical protein